MLAKVLVSLWLCHWHSHFEQVVEICIDLGIARIGTVSVDGTTFRANANKNKMQYRKVLEKRKTKIKQQNIQGKLR